MQNISNYFLYKKLAIFSNFHSSDCRGACRGGRGTRVPALHHDHEMFFIFYIFLFVEDFSAKITE